MLLNRVFIIRDGECSSPDMDLFISTHKIINHDRTNLICHMRANFLTTYYYMWQNNRYKQAGK